MRKHVRALRLLFLASVAFFASNTSAVANPRPPAEAFAALPAYSSIAISMDGGKFAYSVPRDDGNLDVVVYDLSTRIAGRIGLQSSKIRRLQFEDGGRLLVTGSIGPDGLGYLAEFSRVFSIDLQSGSVKTLFTQSSRTRNLNTGIAVNGLLPKSPNLIALSAYDFRDTASLPTLNLYHVALNSPAIELVGRGSPDTYQWQVDEDGNPIARADLSLDTRTSKLWIKVAGGNWRQVLQVDKTKVEGITLLGLSTTGNILFQRKTDSDFGTIEAIDPVTDRVSVMLRAEGIDLSGTFVDKYSQRILGVQLGGINPDTEWLQEDLAEAQNVLETQFPDKLISIADFTPDFKTVLAAVETNSEPKTYYLLNATSKQLLRLGPAMPSLDHVTLGQVRATTFKSRDGVDIPAYVTTPPGHDNARNAPTIVFPHGGPASRDEPGFDWWAQFMASRGYLVIQPQFRGSTGFGNAFADAGFRQWGRRMQDDVSDAVAWAVKEGMTDPSRVCIVGASYGGYSALAGAAMTPDLYKCAVSVAGISDLPEMMREEQLDVGGRPSATVNYWASHIGSDDQSAMEAASPRRLIANIRAPILLIHGKGDSVVKIAQSQKMANALRAANKPVKFVELAGEDHWLSRAETRLQMLREIDAFLAGNLGPGLE